MNCPVCGESAHVKYHQIDPGHEGRQLQCCQKCAIEARKQINAAAGAAIIGPDDRTRTQAVTAALA